MSVRALTDASQLAGLIQLRETATAVNKKHFPLFIHHNAEAWMRSRRDRSAQETNPSRPINGFHAHSIRGKLRELSDKCKIILKTAIEPQINDHGRR